MHHMMLTGIEKNNLKQLLLKNGILKGKLFNIKYELHFNFFNNMNMSKKYKYILITVIVLIIAIIWFISISRNINNEGNISQKDDMPITQIIDKATNKNVDDLNNLHSPITLEFNFSSEIEYISHNVKISGCSIDFDWDWKDDYTSTSDCNPSFSFTQKWKYLPKWFYKWIDGITWKETEIAIKIPEITLVD